MQKQSDKCYKNFYNMKKLKTIVALSLITTIVMTSIYGKVVVARGVNYPPDAVASANVIADASNDELVTIKDLVSVFNGKKIVTTPASVTTAGGIIEVLNPTPVETSVADVVQDNSTDKDRELKFNKKGYVGKDKAIIRNSPKFKKSNIVYTYKINKKLKYAKVNKTWCAVKSKKGNIRFLKRKHIKKKKSLTFDNLNKRNINYQGDRDGWVEFLLPYAIKAYRKYKILPSLTLGQAACESGWGSAQAGSFNIYGMRGYHGWQSFDNYDDATMSYARNLAKSGYYKGVSGCKNYRTALYILEVPYCSVGYAAKVIDLIDDNNLNKWDTKKSMDRWIQKNL